MQAIHLGSRIKTKYATWQIGNRRLPQSMNLILENYKDNNKEKKMSKKEVSTELSAEQLAILNEGYPVSEEDVRTTYPRFGMLSKDITEESGTGKNKKIEVIQASGTFFTEKDEGEVDENGKKIWTKTYIDSEKVDVVIVYHRRQLRMYDSSLEKFYSTPIFDDPNQVVPLYLDKQVVKRGTQAQLQEMFPSVTLKGKPSSKLKEETILYVLYNDELHQFTLSQSSKWNFMSYKRTVNPSSVLTTLSSEEDTFGDNTFRKVTFKNKRGINGGEFTGVVNSQRTVKNSVEADKRFFAPQIAAPANDGLDEIAAAGNDDVGF